MLCITEFWFIELILLIAHSVQIIYDILQHVRLRVDMIF